MLNTGKSYPAVPQNIWQTSKNIYTQNRLKHGIEDLLALVLILIIISCLSYAATNLLSDRTTAIRQNHRANTIVPAIYAHDSSADKISL